MNALPNTNDVPLIYKGRPLLRKDDVIYYGNMTDKFIIKMQILATESVHDLKLSKRVAVQLQLTDPEISATDKIVKSTEKDGLYNAMDIASIWLDRALNTK